MLPPPLKDGYRVGRDRPSAVRLMFMCIRINPIAPLVIIGVGIPSPRVVEERLGSGAASLELEQATAAPVAHEHVQVLSAVGEGDAPDLAKDVDRLLGVIRLGVDDVDEVSFLGCHENPITTADWREA